MTCKIHTDYDLFKVDSILHTNHYLCLKFYGSILVHLFSQGDEIYVNLPVLILRINKLHKIV